MRQPLGPRASEQWYAPLWARVRPVVLKLAATSFFINVLGLLTPLFMMLVVNAVIGRDSQPKASAATMTVLCIGMLIAYTADFGCASRVAGCRPGPARGSMR